MKKQNVFGKIVKDAGAKAAIKAGDRASIAFTATSQKSQKA